MVARCNPLVQTSAVESRTFDSRFEEIRRFTALEIMKKNPISAPEAYLDTVRSSALTILKYAPGILILETVLNHQKYGLLQKLHGDIPGFEE